MEAIGGAFGMGAARERVHDVKASCDTFQERVKEACAGMCVGLLLVLACFGVLAWNEKRTVRMAETVELARDDYVQYDNCVPDPAHDGKLVALGPCGGVPEDTGNGNGVFTDAQLLGGIADADGANFKLTADGSTPLLASWSRHVSVRVYDMDSDSCSEKVRKCTTVNGTTTCRDVTEYNSYNYYKLDWASAPASSHSGFKEQDCKALPYQRIDVTCDSPPRIAGIPDCQKPSNPVGWTSKSSKTSIVCIGDNLGASSTFRCGKPGPAWILGDNGAIEDLLDSSSTLVLQNSDDVAQRLTSDKAGFVCPHNSPDADFADVVRFNRLFQDNDNMTLMKACTTGASGTALVAAGNQNNADHKISWQKSYFASAVSIMGKQRTKNGVWELGEWVNPHHSDCTGCEIFKWQKGTKTGEEWLDDLDDMNTGIKWALRILGWLFMWCGMQLICGPLAMVPGMIPPEKLGDCLEGVAGKILLVLTCCMSTGCSLFVIAIAWLAFRPMVAIPCLIACCCMMAATAGASFMKFQDIQKTKKAVNVADNVAGHQESGATYHAADSVPAPAAPPAGGGGGYPPPAGGEKPPQAGGGYPPQAGGGYPPPDGPPAYPPPADPSAYAAPPGPPMGAPYSAPPAAPANPYGNASTQYGNVSGAA